MTYTDRCEEEHETILAGLKADQIFSVWANGDGTFEFSEECDGYFKATLTREQLKSLASELLALAEAD